MTGIQEIKRWVGTIIRIPCVAIQHINKKPSQCIYYLESSHTHSKYKLSSSAKVVRALSRVARALARVMKALAEISVGIESPLFLL